MSYSVHVSNIAPETTEKSLQDFFTFCGKISSIDFNGSATPKTAVIHFEKPSAVKTALMLNGGTLDGSHLTVTSDTEHPETTEEADHAHDHPHIDQTDKPKSAIVAEYLAKGYTLSDSILQRAIETDQKNGISSRFLSYIKHIDSTLGAKALGPDQTISGKVSTHVNAGVQQAKAFDEQKGITAKASDYYSKAFSSPYGQKVREFYTTTSKQVLDIHEEALRIKAQHAATAEPGPVVPTSTGVPPVEAPAASAPAPTTAAPTTNAPTVV
ncbi:hypothetical protein PUNSTDRAFT_130597 [Punctularia strigosozonata HHB-11173 SS5]|uniref:uncharacterized protein n=1 Tax=Punctularia strigosozonata (strain HHB-11173) TaxID=741275 RepID=UPI0004417C0A|nr:uncharacterized protein PUNSTDRAFT_130597 [Punctularia strigosozonata HHB-11173 SS5]EIN12344.1 hypothetical protein PUNSTDRAFT_130597 [Punctularia strigosozonata HHB-11173 SS5]